MKIFKATFPSMYLGGIAIIVAEHQTEAHKLLNKELSERHLFPLKYEPEWTELATDGIIYFDNGDY